MPEWRHDIATRLRRLCLDPTREAEIVDELSQHLDDRYRELRGAGVSSDEACRLALDELADEDVLSTEMRTLRQALRSSPLVLGRRPTSVSMDLREDVRYSVRALRRAPAFASLAIGILTLSIGINAAVFSLVSAVLFRTLPVPMVDRLVYVSSPSAAVNLQDFWEAHRNVMSSIATRESVRSVFSAAGQDARLAGELVSANYFNVLGVPTLVGRTFRAEEDTIASTEPAVIISEALWMQQFGRNPEVVGQRVRVDQRFFTIVGVAAPGFSGLSEPWNPTKFWATRAQYYGGENPDVARAVSRFSAVLVARLAPGVSVSQARASVRIARDQPTQGRKAADFVLSPVSDVLVPSDLSGGGKVKALRLVAAAVGVVAAMVLLIAAANIAGLLTARGVTRGREVAIRQALGASASRIGRQLVTESLLLAGAGGAGGLLVASWLVHLYRTYSPARFLVDVFLDGRVVVFTAAVCTCAGLLVGTAPALQALKLDVLALLGGTGSAGGTPRVRRRLRHGIVVPQIAMTIVMLIVAGVHVRALMRIELANLGYQTEHLVTLTLGTSHGVTNAPPVPAPRKTLAIPQLFKRVLEETRAVPGVSSVALATMLPTTSLAGAVPRTYVSQESWSNGEAGIRAERRGAVSEGFFQTLGMPIRGRDFDPRRDHATSPRVAIVSERLATQLWPIGDGIGHSLGLMPLGDRGDQKPEWFEVIGIVGDTRPVIQDPTDAPSVYVALSQTDTKGFPLTMVASWAQEPSPPIRPLTSAIVRADPFAEVTNAQTMSQMVGEMLYPRRAIAWIVGVCGLAGLALAAIGLYGVVSYSVAQRLPEIGIRAALGAGRWDIAGLVMREGGQVLGIALIPGACLSFVALRLTSGLVGSVPRADAVTFVLVPLLMMSVVLLACYIPARRAFRVAPAIVLRGQ